jgi:hypothetical protein
MSIHGFEVSREKPSMVRVMSPGSVPDVQHYAVIVYSREEVEIRDMNGRVKETKTFDTFQHWVTTDLKVLEEFLEHLECGDKQFAFFNVLSKGSITKTISFATPSQAR